MNSIIDSLPGQELPSLHFRMDLTTMVKYAAATWDFHRYHYDEKYAKSVGMPAPFVDGQMFGALLARVVTGWGGPECFLRRLSYRQDATVYVDEAVLITGRVRSAGIEAEMPVAHVELSIRKEDGTPVIRHASATVELPLNATAPGAGAAAQDILQ